ncbi:MAG: hypothetical protein BHW12_03775 [Coprobacillus sp. 28_7]|nr:MAG: hypothetical protein BHW12_03775 [Coprobacillus sp. 28_7]
MDKNINSMVPLFPRRKSYLTNLISAIVLIVLVYITLCSSNASKLYINLIGISFRQMKGLMFVILYTIIMAVSLNLSTGCLGELVLCQAGFMAIGAYAGSIFLIKVDAGNASSAMQNVYTVCALAIGFVASGIGGILVGIPALRLRGDYLAIITLGFGQIIVKAIELFKFTGGASGLSKIPINDNLILYLLITMLVVFVLFTFMRSKYGRSILAIREDAIAAESSGINVTKVKIITLAFSAALAGVAGVLLAQLNGRIDPKSFDFNQSINYLVIVVLGGLGSFTGSIISAIVLTLLPESLRFLSDYRLIIYSIILIIIMLRKPGGLLGRYEFSI